MRILSSTLRGIRIHYKMIHNTQNTTYSHSNDNNTNAAIEKKTVHKTKKRQDKKSKKDMKRIHNSKKTHNNQNMKQQQRRAGRATMRFASRRNMRIPRMISIHRRRFIMITPIWLIRIIMIIRIQNNHTYKDAAKQQPYEFEYYD